MPENKDMGGELSADAVNNIAREVARLLGRNLDSINPSTTPIGWAGLPHLHREWLASKSQVELRRLDRLLALSDDNIDSIEESIKMVRDLKTVGRLGRAATLAVVAAFIGAVTFGEKFVVAWKWLTGAPR